MSISTAYGGTKSGSYKWGPLSFASDQSDVRTARAGGQLHLGAVLSSAADDTLEFVPPTHPTAVSGCAPCSRRGTSACPPVLITVPDCAEVRFWWRGPCRIVWCRVRVGLVSARLVHAVSAVVSGARKGERRIVFRRVGLTCSRLEPACPTGGRELPVRTVTPGTSFLSYVLMLQTACSPPPLMHEATRVETETTMAGGSPPDEVLAVDRIPGHAGAVEVGLECADHALRPAEKHRQSSGVIARGREDLVGSEAPVDGRVHEVQAKLLVASAIPSSSEAKGAPPSVEV